MAELKVQFALLSRAAGRRLSRRQLRLQVVGSCSLTGLARDPAGQFAAPVCGRPALTRLVRRLPEVYCLVTMLYKRLRG